MSSDLRHAAFLALRRRYADSEPPNAHVERISLDIELGGARELVSFALRGGDLTWSCTCAQPACGHAHAALGLLAERMAPAPEAGAGSSRAPSSDRRTVAHAQHSSGADPAALAEVLRDLVTAVLRSGVTSGVSASIEEVLQRLIAAAPSPLPLGISRFIGRLKKAISERDADEAARVLHAASQLADDLVASAASNEGQARVVSWLGPLGPIGREASVARITDLSLVEIARELLSGVERAAIERRYLIDPQTGQFYREERAPSAGDASLGPCPRQLTELLAWVEETAPPRRVRLLQYAVTPVIEAEIWEQLSQWALADFGALADQYRRSLTSFAGLGEPFAMVAPSHITEDANSALADGSGHLLPVLGSDRVALSRCLHGFADGGQLLWVAGRLIDRGGNLGLLPLSAAARRNGRISYAQM